MKLLPPWIGIKSPSSSRGFTLVEILVSTAILMLLIVITAQMINGATVSITSNRNRMDADAIARTVFDRMADDIESVVKRRDVDYVCKGASAESSMTGNDSIFFYSEAPAYFSGTTNNSSVALVGYRIASNSPYFPNIPVLQRFSKGLLRDGDGNTPGSMQFLSYIDTSSSIPLKQTTLLGNWPDALSNNSTDAAYHVIASQVFRVEYCYLLKPYIKPDGTVMAARYSTVPYNSADSTHTAVNGFQDVSAIVIAIAILDDSNRKKLTDASGALRAMAGKLEDALETDFAGVQPNLMARKWLEAISAADFAPNGTPKSVAAKVRVYQRHFYLDNSAHN